MVTGITSIVRLYLCSSKEHRKPCGALPGVVYTFHRSAGDGNSKCISLETGGAQLASVEAIKQRALTKICNSERETELMGKCLLNYVCIIENHV